jgi:3-carboxy-cis,cis-muconate cycloisomerase
MSNVFDHPWLGGLLGDDEAAAIWSPERQLTHMLAFESALTRSLGRIGSVPANIANNLADQIAGFQVDLDDLRSGSATDGLPVPALISQLRKMAGENSKAVHIGATSQDVIDTALALTLIEFNSMLRNRLTDAVSAITSLEKKFGTQNLIGRTRMQAALPITAANRLRSWSVPLQNHLQRLEQIRPRVELLQLGGAVGDRAAFSTHATDIAADMAAELGLGNPETSWHATRDGLADYANLLSLISGSVGKIGQDICLMAQQGIGEIGMATGGGSSAMPHKQNPILAELLVTLARYNATQLSGMHHALVHEQERSGTAWTLEWMILPAMARATARSLSALYDVCSQVNHIGAATHQ